MDTLVSGVVTVELCLYILNIALLVSQVCFAGTGRTSCVSFRIFVFVQNDHVCFSFVVRGNVPEREKCHTPNANLPSDIRDSNCVKRQRETSDNIII